MKTHEAILKTSGKTIEQIMAAYDGEKPTVELAENILKSYELIDGCEVIVGEAMFREDHYSLLVWREADDNKFKEFIYTAEQDDYFGTYIDMREEFDEDWKNEEYEPQGALVFSKDDVILKVAE